MNPRDYTYDIECLKNVFTLRATHLASGKKYCFEVSQRCDQREGLFRFLSYLQQHKGRMIGFNNIWYDWEMVQWFMENPRANNHALYLQSKKRISGGGTYPMWPDSRMVQQIDLLKIHHFDNKAKATSLKALEIAMRMDSVEEFECDWDVPLPVEQIPSLLSYNDHDVDATSDFAKASMDMIAFREELAEKYKPLPGSGEKAKDWLNFNDPKIGSEIFIMELEKAGVPCFHYVNGKREPRQTPRESIALAECFFPYIRLEHPAFLMVQDYLKAQVIKETKGVFTMIKVTAEQVKWMDPKRVKVYLPGAKGPRRLCHIPQGTDLSQAKYVAVSLHCRINGFNYDFGTGGIHASLHREIVHSTATHEIKDWDVASYYPNLAIKNRIYPAHLSVVFCDIYEYLFNERNRVGKKTQMGGAYKLALNGTYGNSNNEYSPFYDPMYTMKITINGQLSLCMLVEQLIKVPGLRMIQCNTDGLTFHCPVEYKAHAEALRVWWEQVTKLEMEEVCYSRFFIRDVNNYIAEYAEGYYDAAKPEKRYKRKGAYEYKREWHKDHSALVAVKAVEARMVHGTDIASFIFAHKDPFDFMIRGRVNRDSTLNMVYAGGVEDKLARIIRYYITQDGGTLVKRTMPKGVPGTWKRRNKLTDEYFNQISYEIMGGPGELDSAGMPHDERIHTKNKSRWGDVTETGLCSGQLVSVSSKASDFDWSRVNYMWYIAEAYKLLIN